MRSKSAYFEVYMTILLSKLRNRKFNQTGIGNEGDELVAVG